MLHTMEFYFYFIYLICSWSPSCVIYLGGNIYLGVDLGPVFLNDMCSVNDSWYKPTVYEIKKQIHFFDETLHFCSVSTSTWTNSTCPRACSGGQASGPGQGCDPAAAWPLWAAGAADPEPSGPHEGGLVVSGRFQHHHATLLEKGRTESWFSSLAFSAGWWTVQSLRW